MKSTQMCIKTVIENNFEIHKIVDHQGMELSCALKQPIPTQNQFGSLSLINHSCTSGCIFFNLDIKDGGFPYFQCKNSRMDEQLALIYVDNDDKKPTFLGDL